jgi:hypothetical protein
MHLYDILLPNEPLNNVNALDKIIAVKRSFHWLAFIFGIFWAIYHRIYNMIALIVTISIAGFLLHHHDIVSEIAVEIGSVLINVWFGFEAPNWLKQQLEKRGYRYFTTVSAQNELEAQHQAMTHLAQMQPQQNIFN